MSLFMLSQKRKMFHCIQMSKISFTFRIIISFSISKMRRAFTTISCGKINFFNL